MPIDRYVGRWNIYEMALWQREDLDMLEPAHIAFTAAGGGSLGFICVTGELRHELGQRRRSEVIRFRWEGNDEMDEASGRGWAAVTPDGELEGEIGFSGGDRSTFRARRVGE